MHVDVMQKEGWAFRLYRRIILLNLLRRMKSSDDKSLMESE